MVTSSVSHTIGFPGDADVGSSGIAVAVAAGAGQVEMDVPLLENFSILYAAVELKPTYGHCAEYTDYSVLDPVIFPDQELDGWLRFDIPVAAELIDLRLVFIPESAQVGVSYNSPNYPYAQGKPTYVWKLVP